jgi:hypothetical protein
MILDCSSFQQAVFMSQFVILKGCTFLYALWTHRVLKICRPNARSTFFEDPSNHIVQNKNTMTWKNISEIIWTVRVRRIPPITQLKQDLIVVWRAIGRQQYAKKPKKKYFRAGGCNGLQRESGEKHFPILFWPRTQ